MQKVGGTETLCSVVMMIMLESEGHRLSDIGRPVKQLQWVRQRGSQEKVLLTLPLSATEWPVGPFLVSLSTQLLK
jgi:hypothetical protein